MSLETANKEITKLLVDYGKGDEAAMKELFPLVYRELRRLAQSYLRKEQPEGANMKLLNKLFHLLGNDRIFRFGGPLYYRETSKSFSRRFSRSGHRAFGDSTARVSRP